MTDEIEQKTYEVTTARGRMRFTVPATYKVTYGAIVPGAKGGYSGGGFGIRVWEATDKQRMVMADVTSFRDLSIPVEVEAIRKFGAADDDWYIDDGSWVGEKADQVERAWKPIDTLKGPLPPADDPAEDDDFAPKRLTGMSPRRNRGF